jgi:hypothetical protein
MAVLTTTKRESEPAGQQSTVKGILEVATLFAAVK